MKRVMIRMRTRIITIIVTSSVLPVGSILSVTSSHHANHVHASSRSLLHLKSGLTGHLKRIKKDKDDDEEDDDDEHRDNDVDDDHHNASSASPAVIMIIMSAHLLHLKSGLTGHLKRI